MTSKGRTRWADTGDDKTTAKWSAGIEFRAASQLWLSTGLGSTFGTRAEQDCVILIANMRWNLSDAPRLDPRLEPGPGPPR